MDYLHWNLLWVWGVHPTMSHGPLHRACPKLRAFLMTYHNHGKRDSKGHDMGSKSKLSLQRDGDNTRKHAHFCLRVVGASHSVLPCRGLKLNHALNHAEKHNQFGFLPSKWWRQHVKHASTLHERYIYISM